MRFPTITFGPVAALLLCAGAIVARPQAKDAAKTASKPAPKSEDKKPVPWNIQFDSMESNESAGETEFKNVVAVSDEGTTMHSDNWRLYQKKKTAVATGNLRMTDPQADATGKQADIDYAKGKRLLVLTGDVEIVVKPKKAKESAPPPPGPAPVAVENGTATLKDPNADEDSSDSVRKHPATITCDKLEYEYAKDKKHATLTGSFKVVQKLSDRTRTLTSEHAEWFGLEDRILLHPPVHVEDTKGLKGFDTNEPVTVFVTEGDERILAKKGAGTYEVTDEDDEGKPGKKDSKPATTPDNPPKKKPE